MASRFRIQLHLSDLASLFLFFLLSGFACSTNCLAGGVLPVFPGAEGFGSYTPAGRGGVIVKVTNLQEKGAGSLRAALERPETRIIVFEVGGTIVLKEHLEIKYPFVSIAGQTAPSPGITLRGAGIKIRTHDVLIQHLRIRVGDDPGGPTPSSRDALQVLGPNAWNVMIDHVSASWAIDENMSTWYSVRAVSFSNNIISEGLHHSMHKDGPHSKGMLLGDYAEGISIIGNLFANNFDRNGPLVNGSVSFLAVNNLFYNSGSQTFTSIGGVSGKNLASLVGNVYIAGPDTPKNSRGIRINKNARNGTIVFEKDNVNNNGSAFSVNNGANISVIFSPPVWCYPLTVHDSGKVEKLVLKNAGARPGDRDSVDKRIVEEVSRRRGRIINSQNDVGGWPILPVVYREFPVPINPDGDDDGDGYTNIEEILHHMAAVVEGRPG